MMQRYCRSGSRGPRHLVWVLVLSCLMVAPAHADGIRNEVCADCHELVEHFGTTPHGTYFSVDHRLSEAGCEACHGPAAAHIEEGDPELIINPATDDQFEAGKLCLDCHAGREFDDWAFSEHFTSDIGCTSCHTIHRQGYTSSTTKGPEMCYTCHSDVRAAAYMPSRHPIAEGKIDCIDCHSPHGAQVAFTQERSGRELCFSCHANVEGPFIFEHAPVEEDCMICHTPHGSVADNLLKQNEPALCLDCHAMHFHASIDGLEGNFIPPADSSLLVESTADGWKKGMLTKCSQCHTMVHGSDLPSQAISGGASGLTR